LAQKAAAPRKLMSGARHKKIVETSPAKSALSGRRILLIEDEMLVLMDTEDMLLDLGCQTVLAAASVGQALVHIEGGPLDAALVDVNLNGARSDAVVDALIAHGVPFAFATGYGVHGMRDQDAERPLLMKPYRSRDLARTLSDLIKR
jgi:CheY-like chemotaxis protein